jgi:hypothetical protein
LNTPGIAGRLVICQPAVAAIAALRHTKEEKLSRTIGKGGFRGQVEITGGFAADREAMFRYVQRACDCVAKALDALMRFMPEIKKKYKDNVSLQWILTKENRKFYAGALTKIYLRCRGSADAFKIEILGEDCEGDTVAYTRSGLISIGVNPTMHFYLKFWERSASDRVATVIHEMGRLVPITGDITDDTNDIFRWDKLVEILCRDYDILEKEYIERTMQENPGMAQPASGGWLRLRDLPSPHFAFLAALDDK